MVLLRMADPRLQPLPVLVAGLRQVLLLAEVCALDLGDSLGSISCRFRLASDIVWATRGDMCLSGHHELDISEAAETTATTDTHAQEVISRRLLRLSWLLSWCGREGTSEEIASILVVALLGRRCWLTEESLAPSERVIRPVRLRWMLLLLLTSLSEGILTETRCSSVGT